MSTLAIEFLSKIMNNVRRNRPRLTMSHLFDRRIERNIYGNSVFVWFMTEGCRWDQRGGCTMCNHGLGNKISTDQMIRAIDNGLSSLDFDVAEVFVTPSGSLLDENEVPKEVRQHIYQKISRFPTKYFAFETRAEFITEKNIEQLVKTINNKKIGIEIGLESSDIFIQKYCVNKGNTTQHFINAAKLLAKYNIECIANISLGTAFLDDKEALDDAVNTTKWALSNGADLAVLFPLHIKPFTLLSCLNNEGYYRQPSLWSLVEALDRLDSVLLKKTDISWYRNHYIDKSKIIASPTTCIRCSENVLNLLDTYRMKRDIEIVNKLKSITCDCKNKWKSEIEMSSSLNLFERIWEKYEFLSKMFSLNDWLVSHGHLLKEEMKYNFNNRSTNK